MKRTLFYYADFIWPLFLQCNNTERTFRHRRRRRFFPFRMLSLFASHCVVSFAFKCHHVEGSRSTFYDYSRTFVTFWTHFHTQRRSIDNIVRTEPDSTYFHVHVIFTPFFSTWCISLNWDFFYSLLYLRKLARVVSKAHRQFSLGVNV